MSDMLIRKLEQFTRLGTEDRRALERVASTRIIQLAPGEHVIEEGEAPDAVNLFLDGWGCRYKDLEDGRRQILAFFIPGDFCDLNIFILRRMDHSIAALTPLSVARIPRDEMEEITLGHPRITQALWWETLVTAAIQREWTVNVGQRDATERLAHLLCELFVRLRGVGLTNGDACAVPLTQSQIAEATGLSLVHVNRTLMALRDAGLATLRRRRLIIHDPDALMRAALFNPNYLHMEREGQYLDANE